MAKPRTIPVLGDPARRLIDSRLSAPVTDDETREFDTHKRGRFTPGLIFQVKSATDVDHRLKTRRLD